MPDPWIDDDNLLAALREALGETPAPDPSVVAAARGAFAWRGVDAELAALVYDSSLDDALSARVRLQAGPRVLTFESDFTAVEIGIRDAGVSGQLLPPGPGTIEVRTPSGPVSRLDTDDLGVFTLDEVPSELVSLRCVTATGDVVVTDWVRLTS